LHYRQNKILPTASRCQAHNKMKHFQGTWRGQRGKREDHLNATTCASG